MATESKSTTRATRAGAWAVVDTRDARAVVTEIHPSEIAALRAAVTSGRTVAFWRYGEGIDATLARPTDPGKPSGKRTDLPLGA